MSERPRDKSLQRASPPCAPSLPHSAPNPRRHHGWLPAPPRQARWPPPTKHTASSYFRTVAPPALKPPPRSPHLSPKAARAMFRTGDQKYATRGASRRLGAKTQVPLFSLSSCSLGSAPQAPAPSPSASPALPLSSALQPGSSQNTQPGGWVSIMSPSPVTPGLYSGSPFSVECPASPLLTPPQGLQEPERGKREQQG